MKREKTMRGIKEPDKIMSYFRLEIWPLAIVTISGIIYNIGMTAGPYFEGQLAQRLFDIINGTKTLNDMLVLAAVYLAVILIVQLMRCIKRFYVRRFANDTSRNMRHILYNGILHKSRAELEEEGVGAMMTKAVADVDACSEGMRKFTTEVFDTGVALAAYLVMLFVYDWRLALISCSFTPIAYIIADRLKGKVAKYNSEYKKSAGRLNDATLDRVSNAVTYRVYSRETARGESYDKSLADYEKKAVSANIWENTMQPLYNIISMCGAVPIIYFGARNVIGSGWTAWNIAAFTAFISCFAKMAIKSSKAAKLFNSVQKAQVSWKRIKPLMRDYGTENTDSAINFEVSRPLEVSHLTFAYPGGGNIIEDMSFSARPGEIIGVTGPVASGKSSLGKAFLCELPYGGSIKLGGLELSELSEYERSRLISYMGHQPELMSDTIRENICLGGKKDPEEYIRAVCLDGELAEMPDGENTWAGSGGVRLSGGQQARVALARTLYYAGNVIILDDPFSAVDRDTEKKIMENISEMAKDKIVILISHRLDVFSEFNRVIWMDGSRAEVSTHEKLMRGNKLYARLYRAQMSGGEADEN